MTRITKNPEERKEEIIATAQILFIEKGFAETKVSDIVKSIGVSQGIFYYYFKSKDDIIDEIVSRYITEIKKDFCEIIENNKLSNMEKIEKMADVQLKINKRLNYNIHSIKGVDIHEKVLKKIILDIVPLLQKAFSGTVDKNSLLLFEIFIAAGNVLFDPGIFQWEKEAKNERITFLISLMDKSFNVSKGTFSFYKKLMGFVS